MFGSIPASARTLYNQNPSIPPDAVIEEAQAPKIMDGHAQLDVPADVIDAARDLTDIMFSIIESRKRQGNNDTVNGRKQPRQASNKRKLPLRDGKGKGPARDGGSKSKEPAHSRKGKGKEPAHDRKGKGKEPAREQDICVAGPSTWRETRRGKNADESRPTKRARLG